MKRLVALLLIILPFIVSAQWSGTNPIYYNSGRVGIGTSSPSYGLHINKSTSDASFQISRTGLSPGTITSTFEPRYEGASIWGSFITSNGGHYFKNNSTIQMALTSGGYLGLGVSTPSLGLELSKPYSTAGIKITGTGFVGDITGTISSKYGGASDVGLTLESSHSLIFSGSGYNFKNGSTRLMTITSSGDVGIGTSTPSEELEVAGNIKCVDLIETSDRSLKTNIREDFNSHNDLYQLKTYRYTLQSDSSHRERIGLMAQELMEIYPELVFGTDATGYGISYTKLIPLLIRAMQDQNQTILALQKEVNTLIDQQRIKTPGALVKVYPNPTHDLLTVTLNQAIPTKGRIEIINLNGQTMINQVISDRSLTISTINLMKGVYFLNLITNDDVVETKRIMIDK